MTGSVNLENVRLTRAVPASVFLKDEKSVKTILSSNLNKLNLGLELMCGEGATNRANHDDVSLVLG